MKIIPGNLSKRDSHELMMSAILPRPIAFVSTVGEDGVFNLAPFSCFAPVSSKPAMVCLGVACKRDGEMKDTLRNIEFTKDFVVNVVTEALVQAMNQSSASYPSDVDEFKEVGLTAVKSEMVKAPRVAESPVNLECRVAEILKYGKPPFNGNLIIGEVVLVHVKDELWAGEDIDIAKWNPVGRLGGKFYWRKGDIFAVERPEDPF